MLFGKLALRCLFEDYFEEARHFSTRIMLKPIDDPHVDLIATVSVYGLMNLVMLGASMLYIPQVFAPSNFFILLKLTPLV